MARTARRFGLLLAAAIPVLALLAMPLGALRLGAPAPVAGDRVRPTTRGDLAVMRAMGPAVAGLRVRWCDRQDACRR